MTPDELAEIEARIKTGWADATDALRLVEAVRALLDEREAWRADARTLDRAPVGALGPARYAVEHPDLPPACPIPKETT